MRIKKILMVLTAMVCVAVPGKALSFALDSVAEWGKVSFLVSVSIPIVGATVSSIPTILHT